MEWCHLVSGNLGSTAALLTFLRKTHWFHLLELDSIFTRLHLYQLVVSMVCLHCPYTRQLSVYLPSESRLYQIFLSIHPFLPTFFFPFPRLQDAITLFSLSVDCLLKVVLIKSFPLLLFLNEPFCGAFFCCFFLLTVERKRDRCDVSSSSKLRSYCDCSCCNEAISATTRTCDISAGGESIFRLSILWHGHGVLSPYDGVLSPYDGVLSRHDAPLGLA